MNVWKLTAANTLVKSEEEPRQEEGKLRVRVTKVLLNSEDGAIFAGRRKARYPLIPGRFAVGVVADEGGSAMCPKGARVLLHSYLPAEDTGTEKKNFTEDDFRVLGHTADGFLRDFVYLREDEMTPLPDSVGDDKALLIHFIALAQATVETLGVKRGEHIAVIGGNLLGLFTARLLIYRQAAPILIDSRRDRLDFARARGVYYTSPTDASLLEMVGTVTGGRLADGVAFINSAGIDDRALPVSVCAPGRHIAFCGLCGDSFSQEIGDVVRKNLTLHGVPDGTDSIEMAVNLIANRAIDLSAFRFNAVPADHADALLKDLSENPVRPADEINVVNLA